MKGGGLIGEYVTLPHIWYNLKNFFVKNFII
nr:MAG TPA: hypothetical protein [Crassvirales sp.]